VHLDRLLGRCDPAAPQLGRRRCSASSAPAWTTCRSRSRCDAKTQPLACRL